MQYEVSRTVSEKSYRVISQLNAERFLKDEKGDYVLNENDRKTLLPELNADNDYAYITNVNCTRGITNSMGKITDDHRNFTNYRLYTLVITYEGQNSADKKDQKIAARSYIRYYDANGKLRVFYNTYKKSMFSGCLCSYEQVSAMPFPQDLNLLEQQQKPEGE